MDLPNQAILSSPVQEYTGTIDVCVEDETIKYLNRKDVMEALHAQLVGVDQWTVCSE